MGELEITILGSGSSGGVPRGDGDWGVCDPAEPRNRRTRCSLLARRSGPEGTTSLVIDTSPDLREQALAAKVSHVDAVLYTHDHADQTHGIDDLRVFYINSRRQIAAYMDEATRDALTRRFDYIFASHLGYPAILSANTIAPHGTRWQVEGAGGAIPIVTFDQAHGPIRSVGYRLGNMVYSPDVSDIDEAGIEAVCGADLWIVDALRYAPHPTHAHLDRTLDWIAKAKVKRAVLTNLHIDMDYKTLSRSLPANVEVGFDGWTGQIKL